jgi:hypothetical protein
MMGAFSLLIHQLRNDIRSMTVVCDEIDSVLQQSDWFIDSPFEYISLIICYTHKTELMPKFKRIVNKGERCGELPITLELNLEELQAIDRDLDKLTDIFRSAIIPSLFAIADKYHLSKGVIEEYKSQRTKPNNSFNRSG